MIIGLIFNTTRVANVFPFPLDSTKPDVILSTSSPRITKASNIDVIVAFTKPIFGFQKSALNVGGGRITRQVPN